MSKTKRVRQRKQSKAITTKEKRELAIVNTSDEGVMGIDCPFCQEPHPIRVGIPAHCGTSLELTAVNVTHRGKVMTCTICGEQGGTMVKNGEHYRHNYNCTPGVNVYSGKQPTLSWTAGLFYKYASDDFLIWWANTFHRAAEQLKPLNKDGEVVEDVLGYAWRQVNAAVRK